MAKRDRIAGEWLPISSEGLDLVDEKIQKGVLIRVLVSPYDVPEAVRGYYDEDQDRFVVEFKYFEDEATVREQADENIVFHVGRRSRRLRSIALNIKALGVGAVGLTMHTRNAIDGFKSRLPATTADNYRLASDVISERGGQLFADLVTP